MKQKRHTIDGIVHPARQADSSAPSVVAEVSGHFQPFRPPVRILPLRLNGFMGRTTRD